MDLDGLSRNGMVDKIHWDVYGRIGMDWFTFGWVHFDWYIYDFIGRVWDRYV